MNDLLSNFTSEEVHIKEYKEDFLSADNLKEAEYFLHSIPLEDYTKENGRLVISFGTAYPYNGSKSQPKSETILPALAKMIHQFQSSLNLEHPPNSVLINFYPPVLEDGAPDSSRLPYHSDDEMIIHPESDIITLDESMSLCVCNFVSYVTL